MGKYLLIHAFLDPNRLMKRAKMQSINIGDAISAQRRQFAQSIRREEGTELLTIPDTVARYKTVTLVNISDQQLGIVFAKVHSYSTIC